MKNSLLFLIVFIALVLLGFVGYLAGFLGFVYDVMMPAAFDQYGIVVLAVIFGVGAFFSPCAFTVLPAFVAHYLSHEEKHKKHHVVRQSLFVGLLAALGVISVNLVIGVVIALLGSAAPFTKDPREDIWIVLAVRIVAGLVIAMLGVFTVLGKSIRIPLLRNFLSEKKLGKSMFAYGVMYNAAALGCTGPIMLGLIVYAFAQQSFVGALTAFVWFSLTMGFLMALMTLFVGLGRESLLHAFVKISPEIKKFAGVVMIIVGLTMAVLTLEGNKIFVDIFFPFLK